MQSKPQVFGLKLTPYIPSIASLMSRARILCVPRGGGGLRWTGVTNPTRVCAGWHRFGRALEAALMDARLHAREDDIFEGFERLIL